MLVSARESVQQKKSKTNDTSHTHSSKSYFGYVPRTLYAEKASMCSMCTYISSVPLAAWVISDRSIVEVVELVCKQHTLVIADIVIATDAVKATAPDANF